MWLRTFRQPRETVAVNKLHPLGKLIQESQDKHGWSTRDLEREADGHGYSMKHSNFSRLKLEPVVAIKATQIEILSKVLRQSQRAIATAAIESMGVDLGGSAVRIEDAIRSSQEFSTRDRRILLSVVDVMRDDESGSNEDQDEPETNPPGPRALRAVGSGREVVAGQKIDPEDPEYLKPLEREQMAAHPNVKLHRDKFDEIYGDAGEENQDTDGE